jgi:hypothetical protein
MTRIANKHLQLSPIAVAVSSGAITLNPKAGRYFIVDVDANVTSVTINAPPAACDFTVLLQFAGSYSVQGFPSIVKWGVGTNQPPFSGTNGQEVFINMAYFDATNGYRVDASQAYTPTAES